MYQASRCSVCGPPSSFIYLSCPPWLAPCSAHFARLRDNPPFLRERYGLFLGHSLRPRARGQPEARLFFNEYCKSLTPPLHNLVPHRSSLSTASFRLCLTLTHLSYWRRSHGRQVTVGTGFRVRSQAEPLFLFIYPRSGSPRLHIS